MNCVDEVNEICIDTIMEEANTILFYLNNVKDDLIKYIPDEIYLTYVVLDKDIHLKIFLNKNNNYEVIVC